jgi:hypothetical protein
MKNFKLPSLGAVLLAWLLAIVFFGEPDEPDESFSDKLAAASEKVEKLEAQIEEEYKAITPEIFDETITTLQNETQILDVFYQKGALVEWTLIVDGKVYLNSDGSIAQYYDVEDSIKHKTWNAYAMAMCNFLYQTGYANEGDKREHIVRIVDYSTLKITEGHSRKSSLGSCDCRAWKPFDKAK